MVPAIAAARQPPPLTQHTLCTQAGGVIGHRRYSFLESAAGQRPAEAVDWSQVGSGAAHFLRLGQAQGVRSSTHAAPTLHVCGHVTHC